MGDKNQLNKLFFYFDKVKNNKANKKPLRLFWNDFIKPT